MTKSCKLLWTILILLFCGLGLEANSPMPLPADLVAVPDAPYAPLAGLAAGSREAQEAQRQAVTTLGLPLEVKARKSGLVFRLLPAGKFLMGSPVTESGRQTDEGPQREVSFSQPLYVGKYEVTQGEWLAVMGSDHSRYKDAGRRAPVEEVSWEDCQVFLKKLCAKEGVPDGTYRLLTEEEWEYACRGGTSTAFSFGTSLEFTQANFNGNRPRGEAAMGPYKEKTVPVGTYSPNSFGLYDMHGNVWEWCSDWYGGYADGAELDPFGPAAGEGRINRGGSWGSGAKTCRAANRGRDLPGMRDHSVGLRVARRGPVPTGP